MAHWGVPPKPPASPPPSIETVVLPAGTCLSRIHRTAFDSCSFNPTVPLDPWQGGRFDCDHAHPYGSLYAGSDDGVAIAETLLRDADLDERDLFLPRARLDGRALGWIATTRPLVLVKLHGTGLGRVKQNSGWLVMTDESEYAFTRAWGYAIRDWVPAAAGFVWRAKRDNDGFAYVFFDDRCGPDSFEAVTHPDFAPDTGFPLSGPAFTGKRLDWFERQLRPFGYTLGPPPP
jgi:hypothetical protein